MAAIGQAVGGQGIAHQHQLPTRQPLQQHRHGGCHMDAIGDQAQVHPARQQGRRHGPGRPVVEAGHGVEAVGEHRHPGAKGGAGLGLVGLAVAQAHHDPQLLEGADDRAGPLQFRGQGDQINLLFKAADPLQQGRGAGFAQMDGGMGAAAGVGQERALQVGAQQAAAAAAVPLPGGPQHGQGLAQGGHGAGHQGGADRFDAIAPEQLQQGLQLG